LADKGREEAKDEGELLRGKNFKIDVVHMSVVMRAVQT
jgi:bisphosphoglycerate-dependent phosphoglycerate mutase